MAVYRSTLWMPGSRIVEVMLQWADDLDDLLAAAGQVLLRMSDLLPGLAGVTVAGLGGISIGLAITLLVGPVLP